MDTNPPKISSLSEANQIIHQLREQVQQLKNQVNVLKRTIADETEIRYQLYKKLSKQP
jgi:RNA binding exosome subunit